MNCLSTRTRWAVVSVPIWVANSLNLLRAVPSRHVRQYWYWSGPVVTLLLMTPSLITRIPQRTSRTDSGLSRGLNRHLILGDASFVGSVRISISLMLMLVLEIFDVVEVRISSIMIGPWRLKLSFLPLEKPFWPLVVFSLLECFIAWQLLLRLLSAWLIVR